MIANLVHKPPDFFFEAPGSEKVHHLSENRELLGTLAAWNRGEGSESTSPRSRGV